MQSSCSCAFDVREEIEDALCEVDQFPFVHHDLLDYRWTSQWDINNELCHVCWSRGWWVCPCFDDALDLTMIHLLVSEGHWDELNDFPTIGLFVLEIDAFWGNKSHNGA